MGYRSLKDAHRSTPEVWVPICGLRSEIDSLGAISLIGVGVRECRLQLPYQKVRAQPLLNLFN